MLVVYKGIWQFDAMEAMTNLILLDRRFQLFTWLQLVLPNCLITRMRQHLMWMIAILLMCFGSPAAAIASTAGEEVVVFRSAYCECCEAWESHIAEAGFVVQDHVADDMDGIKEAMGVPADSASCHTARVSGYVVEGHVPAASIQRMLKERPEIKGLAAPGMPMGSPGMEVEGMAADPFSIYSIQENGAMIEFDFYGSH